MLDERRRRAAFEARDRSADGLFLAGVMTTGIYCRPSCPARRPRPENVRFYADAESARADGLRACLRCRPDDEDSTRDGIARANALIESAEYPPGLVGLAAAAGLSRRNFHHRVRDATGVTPPDFARPRRTGRAQQAMTLGETEGEPH